MTWCARIRFRLPLRVQINCPDRELPLPADSREDVRLIAAEPEKTIQDARNIALLCKGYATEQDAQAAGARWRTTLQKAFARTNVPADFGDRAAIEVVTRAGIEMLEAQHGVRVLNDVHGVMVFECEPWPRFAKVETNFVVGRLSDKVVTAIEAAATLNPASDERESVAFDLFSASFAVSEGSSDARFAMLMMALETLLEAKPRSPESLAHVDRLIAETKSAAIEEGEKASMLGSLQYLRQESIGQSGRRLAAGLGTRTYLELAPEAFFSRCYTLRSRLVHGHHPRPSRAEVERYVGALEQFVRDVLSRELLDIVPD